MNLNIESFVGQGLNPKAQSEMSFILVLHQVVVFFALISFPFYVTYLVKCGLYHWENRHVSDQEARVPPTLPYIVPGLGHAISFVRDTRSFVKRVTSYAGNLTCVQISLPVFDACLVQEPKAVAALFKSAMFSSPIVIYTIALETLFGMKAAARAVYAADNSGPFRKPHPQSNVAPHNRVDFLTHDSLIRGLMGVGLLPAFNRYQKNFAKHLQSTVDQHIKSNAWTTMPDLQQFFRDNLGQSVVESFFGPLLLKVNPTFMEDLWEFDDATPLLSKRLPRWLIPRAYHVRDSLLKQIQTWYRHARLQFKESLIYPDGNGDPFWGSAMMRERQEFLLAADGQNDESLASPDLGLIWVSITNLVPSTMMMALQVFSDPVLLGRIRESLRDSMTVTNSGKTGQAAQVEIDINKALKNPLLQAAYAETLRLHVQAFVTRSSAHEPVQIQNWWLQQEQVVMVNSYPNHIDKHSWNEGPDGAHPIDTFWADRFLRDPQDPQSGPLRVNPAAREVKKESSGTPYCSLDGLEGIWIPYGGGSSACPGRVFAKRVILYTCAYLFSNFDMDVQPGWEMDSSSFGLGTQKPKGKLPFAIRRRTVPLEEMQPCN